MKQKTKREEFCFSFLTWLYAAFPETYAFAPTRKPVQGSRSNASGPSVPQLSACQEFTLFGRGFRWSDLFCWNVKGLVLEFFLLVHSLLCFVSGYFHLGHSFTSDPAYHWTPFSEMCQLVSGCVAMSVSVSTVSKSPEDDCWAIWSSSPGSQWMPDSQNW